MEKKYLIKFKDNLIRGPFSELEIDDMIYDNIINGEEDVREYPDGEWINIAKIEHFYDVFMGAFEIEKEVKVSDKETFIDSPTKTNIKNKKDKVEKTTIQEDISKKTNNKKKDKVEKTEIYNSEDIRVVAESLIKKKEHAILDPEKKSPIIPQAVIVSLDEPREHKTLSKKTKLIIGASLVLLLILLVSGLSNSDDVDSIDINGVKLEKNYMEIKLPVAETIKYSPQEALKLKQEAVKLLSKDNLLNYKKALNLLHEAAEHDVNSASILSYIAYCYARLYNISKKDPEYANALRAIINRAEKSDKNIETISLAKMAYFNSQKDYKSSISIFNELMTLIKDPTKIDNKTLTVAAEALIGGGEYNSAFQITSSINKNQASEYPRSYYIQALIRMNNKEYEMAATDLRTALRLNPDHSESQIKLFEMNKDAAATKMFTYLKENVSNINHEDASTILYLLGNIAVQNSDIESANLFYEKALDFSSSNVKAMIAFEQLGGDVSKYKKTALQMPNTYIESSTFLMRGDELLHLQKYRDSSLQYRMATSLEPQNMIAWYKLGESYRLSYEYAKAIDAYSESLKIDKLSLPALVKLSIIQTDLYLFQEATNNLKKAQEIDPENPDALFAIGYLHAKSGMEKEAVEYYHKAVSQNFSHVDSLFMLAKLNLKYEKYDEARLLFEKVLNAQPDMFESYIYLARILARTDHISKAERYVENLKKMFPDVAEISVALAMAYMDAMDYDRAELQLKEALKKNKYSILALKYYAELSQKLGRNKDAVSYYDTIAIIAPYYLEAYDQKSKILCSLGQQANCEQELLKLVELCPRYPMAHYTLAKMYYKNEQYENTEEALTREIEYNPFIRNSYLLLGDTYIKLNKAQKAVELYSKMLKENKKDPYGLLGLAKAYYAAKDFTAAETMVKQARHIDPSINDIYHVECIIFYQMKMFAEAKNSCEEFIKRAPDDANAGEVKDIISKISN